MRRAATTPRTNGGRVAVNNWTALGYISVEAMKARPLTSFFPPFFSSTSFWAVSHGGPRLYGTLHARCGVPCLVPMLIGG